MNKHIKKKWIEALRSGEYEQGTRHLSKDNKYCCLGVLCELAVKEGVVKKDINEGVTSYDNKSDFLPPSVASWADMDNRGYYITYDGSIDGLYWNNDEEGLSFSQIADIIEEYL